MLEGICIECILSVVGIRRLNASLNLICRSVESMLEIRIYTTTMFDLLLSVYIAQSTGHYGLSYLEIYYHTATLLFKCDALHQTNKLFIHQAIYARFIYSCCPSVPFDRSFHYDKMRAVRWTNSSFIEVPLCDQ